MILWLWLMNKKEPIVDFIEAVAMCFPLQAGHFTENVCHGMRPWVPNANQMRYN
jgi:hypothetical protein